MVPGTEVEREGSSMKNKNKGKFLSMIEEEDVVNESEVQFDMILNSIGKTCNIEGIGKY